MEKRGQFWCPGRHKCNVGMVVRKVEWNTFPHAIWPSLCLVHQHLVKHYWDWTCDVLSLSKDQLFLKPGELLRFQTLFLSCFISSIKRRKKRILIQSRLLCGSLSQGGKRLRSQIMYIRGTAEIAVCMMFDIELSLRIILHFAEEHCEGISGQIQIKSKKSSGSASVREHSRATSKASAALV